ncbi:hypothetical protein OC846_002540 [Tilletia horrida]|uniref:Lysophospholipase n=1 Tax=Tilletia horrida TaxID=155126 RepID=A0AAN6JSV5_9BASI|nr:hypothetical protein OC846_002540 [Tilletia horrida]
MTFAVSLRRSRWWLYTKAYILGAMVSLFTATPVSSRIPSAPAQIQQQLTRLQTLRENVQREETRFREALSRAGIPTTPGPQRDGDIDLEQGLGPGSPPISPTSRPWAIERALESLGERAQAEARQRQQMLAGPLVDSPASEPDLTAYQDDAFDAVQQRQRASSTSTYPPMPRQTGQQRARPQSAGSAGYEPRETSETTTSRLQTILRRWASRFQDLRNVRRLMQRDDESLSLYPELQWDARVRKGNDLNQLEVKFVQARIKKMCTRGPREKPQLKLRVKPAPQKRKEVEGATFRSGKRPSDIAEEQELSPLHRFLGLPASEDIHPDDVPIVSLGGSGGGYRAKFGFAAFIAALETGGAWQVTTYVAGVSGSCWTIAELYTHAQMSPHVLLEHYKRVASELAHPLSLKALNVVASTRHGVYFLLAPLLRKAQSGVVGLGVMDLYATMTTCYQFLPRPVRTPQNDVSSMLLPGRSEFSLLSNQEEARAAAEGRVEASTKACTDSVTPSGLSRSTFQWSKTLTRANLLPADIAAGPALSTTQNSSEPSSSSAKNGGAAPLPILTAVRVSYADQNPPSFLTRKAGIGRRGPNEDDFEREELPQYKAQTASDEDLSAQSRPPLEPRPHSAARLESHQRHISSPTRPAVVSTNELKRVRSEPRSRQPPNNLHATLEHELERERGGLPHPYDELIDIRHLRQYSDLDSRAPLPTPNNTLSTPPRMLRGPPQRPPPGPMPSLNLLEENLTPQERLARARALIVHSRRQRARALAEQASSATGLGVAFQWFEISPIEMGSSDVGAWIPTWSYGRTFLSGKSLTRQPEASLSLFLGQCTSAPAGPLTGYIAALLASLPAGWTLAASLLGWVNALIRAKRWERRWGNPIRAADEPNPFYGLNLNNETAVAAPARDDGLENDVRGAASGSAPRIPPRAMVRGRGANHIYNPHAGIEASPASEKKDKETTRTFATSSNSRFIKVDRHKMPPRAMARGRGLSHIYPQHADNSIDMASNRLADNVIPLDPSLAKSDGRADPTAQAISNLTTSMWTWEASGRIKLMDSGLSNNLPSHVLMHPGRNVDVIIAFDASSDVQKGAAIQRIHEFGRDRGLRFRLRQAPGEESEDDSSQRRSNETPSQGASTASLHPDGAENGPQHGSDTWREARSDLSPRDTAGRAHSSHTAVHQESLAGDKIDDPAEQIRRKFGPKYAQVLDGWRVRPSFGADAVAGVDDDWVDVEEEEAMFAREPDVRMIYCPLLPNARIPDFDPSTSAFSTSYNLVWTPEQVETLVSCTKHNVEDYALDVIRDVMREVYESKKQRRLQRQSKPSPTSQPGHGHESRTSLHYHDTAI